MTTSDEVAVVSDRVYWNELATALSWTLYGWTDRKDAQFYTGSDSRAPLERVTGKMRDDILAVISGKKPQVIRHGETCEKVEHRSKHVSGAYLHPFDSDAPYDADDADGVMYCGRCHKAL